MKPYFEIANQIAARIAKGELAVGERLPPQRQFAYANGIAVSTASRVFEELRRRGLVSGEIGRGTFVSSRFTPLDPALQEPSGKGIDLEIMFRLGRDARDCIAASTARFFKDGLSLSAASPSSVKGNTEAASVLAGMTSVKGARVIPENLFLAGNGKQAIAAVFSALAPRGGRIAVEALTYPFAISVARTLGIELLPLSVDEEGIEPDALDLVAQRGVDAVYLQPTLQSPLVLTMSNHRRQRIADILKKHDLTAVEDRVYGFLRPTLPVGSFAPENVIQVDSLSKRLTPGLSLGIITAPSRYHKALAKALRSGGWTAPSLSVALARHWIEDGVVAAVEESKRKDARDMFEIASATFSDLQYSSSPEALHGWLTLPDGWRSESFTAACADLGIAVAPGSAFAVGKSVAPSGVRIAGSAPDLHTWQFALKEVAQVALRDPKSP